MPSQTLVTLTVRVIYMAVFECQNQAILTVVLTVDLVVMLDTYLPLVFQTKTSFSEIH